LRGTCSRPRRDTLPGRFADALAPLHARTLACGDGNHAVVYAQETPFTDFPLDEVTLWFANSAIYLAGEH